VVGWALADHMRTELISNALLMAFGQRRPPAGAIFHSDRGCQYTSRDFRQVSAVRASIRSAVSASKYDQPSLGPGIGITTGPDGALWFSNGDSIGRLATDGVLHTFTGPDIDDAYAGIAVGSDGALWFTNSRNNSIGRVTTSGVVTNYSDTTIDQPWGIAAGPDGALWFTNASNNSIGRITTSGVVTNYTNPGIDTPFGITEGPDAAMWFTNANGDSIGRITTSGAITIYTDSSIGGPTSIVTGSDGALWFTNNDYNTIGRITTSGVVTSYSDPIINYPESITAGPDGALWFTNAADGVDATIARITTSGTVTDYTKGRHCEGGFECDSQDAVGIASGPDGALWFTGSWIGRITTSGVESVYKGPTLLISGGDPPGSAVTVTGAGFQPSETVRVVYKTGLTSPSLASVPICSATVTNSGSYSCPGRIPTEPAAGPHEDHTIIAKGETSLIEVKSTYYVGPSS
jgi:virginiamycin B lyase